MNFINFEFGKFSIKLGSLKEWLQQVLRIPTYLKYLLFFVILGGTIYFGVEKYNRELEISYLKSLIENINSRVSNIVTIDLYENDKEFIVASMLMMEWMSNYSYEESQLQLELIYNFVLKHHKDEVAILYDIQAMKSRNEVTHETFSNHFRNLIQAIKGDNTHDQIDSLINRINILEKK